MKLPVSWTTLRLGEISTDIQPGFAQSPKEIDSGIGQIRTHNVTPDGEIDLTRLKFVNPSEKEAEKYLLQKGDIVFNNTNSEELVGKTALFSIEEPLLFSNHMTRIRVNEQVVFPSYIARYLHYLWRAGFSRTRSKRWVNQAGIDQTELAQFKVLLPPLPEQQRIVEILSQADELRNLRRETIEQAKQLPGALFLEMFGDILEEHKNYHKTQLSKLCDIVGGGTPSKSKTEYWNGSIPWVSPKDMKGFLINDAQDHITENAIADSATHLIPRRSILVVTRSGILKHTLPVAMNEVEVAINQDIKALIHSDDLLTEFLLVQLHLISPFLLSKVRIGATVHNIQTEELRSLPILVPPIKRQQEFVDRLMIAFAAQTYLNETCEYYEELFQGLLSATYTGSLTQSWRNAHREYIKKWLHDHPEFTRQKKTRASITEEGPPERPEPDRVNRHGLIKQLSEIQGDVYSALKEWKGTLIPSEDLDDFLAIWPVEHVEDEDDHVLRALNQLAGLGFIAKVSVPNEAGDYVTGFRMLRDVELTLLDDRNRLPGLA